MCAHDLPGLASPRLPVGPLAYVCLHGGTGKYVGRYREAALAGWSEWSAEQARAGRAVWAYFNNDIGGAAIPDALTLRTMLRQELSATQPIEAA